MNSSFKNEWAPFWSSAVKIENGGRYPLGLNHFHNHLDNYINRNIVYGSEKLSVFELNKLLENKIFDKDTGDPLPFKCCPKCGGDKLSRSGAEDFHGILFIQ